MKVRGYCEVCLAPLELPEDFDNSKRPCVCEKKSTGRDCQVIHNLFKELYSDKAYAVRQFFQDWQNDQKRLPPP